MKAVSFIIQITNVNALQVQCKIQYQNDFLGMDYVFDGSKFKFSRYNSFTDFLLNNQHQLAKILKSALSKKKAIPPKISAVIIENFRFLEETDYQQYILLDQRSETPEISTSSNLLPKAYRIYTDGSYSNELHRSAYGCVLESPEGEQGIYSFEQSGGGNNLMELLPVIKGLELLNSESCVEVYTDSRYVIRGLCQWVHFWRLNQWETAYGCGVKFTKEWQKADALCQGKLIVFKWIKGHSGHKSQQFCHELAKELATGKKNGFNHSVLKNNNLLQKHP